MPNLMKTWVIEHAQAVQKLHPDQLATLVQQGSVLTLHKSDTLDPATEGNDVVLILLEGYAKLISLNNEGKRFALCVLRSGDFLGSLTTSAGFMGDDAPLEFVEAMADCKVLRVGGKAFRQLIDSQPAMTRVLLQQLEGQNRRLQRKVTDLLFKDVYARMAQLFLELVFEHGEACPYAFGLKHDILLKHHEIAELIGASRPVTSVTLGQFIKADLLHKHDGVLCLQDLNALRAIASQGVVALHAYQPIALASVS
jgi:CRP-like cAMP-binding protein